MMKNLRVTILQTFALVLLSSQLFAQVVFLVEEPQSLAGGYDFTFADTWGADMDTITLTAPAAFADDDGTFNEPGFGPTGDSAACGPIVSDVAGKIAVVYRGGCQFSSKALNVQQAGAVACVIINNIPGAPVGMAGGTVAASVTIPVVMISSADGAALRNAILNDEVVIYLGNNTGVFEYNVGTYPDKVSRAQSTATPMPLIGAGEPLTMSAWTFNYGSEDATGVKLNAILERDGNEVFNDTTDGVTVPALGDSVLLAFPEQTLTEPGYYTLTYNVFADSADQFPNDNEITMNFWLNESGVYAKSRIVPGEGPLTSGAVRPAAEPFAEWEWCTALNVTEANGMSITGVQFSTTTADSTVDIIGKSVFIRVYEWNDYVPGGTTFGTLNELTGNEIYDYTENLDNEFVLHGLAEPVELIDNQRYLTCLFIDDEEIFVAYDTETDYTLNYNSVFADEPVSPLYDEGDQTWFLLGFGNDAVPAIVTIMEDPNSVSEDVEALNVTPYPNPTTDFINIPVGGLGISGDVLVEVFDVTGSLVLSDNVCVKSSDMRLDVTDLSSGLHFFNLTFEDNSKTTFRVVVTK